jgi:hypothetical protein
VNKQGLRCTNLCRVDIVRREISRGSAARVLVSSALDVRSDMYIRRKSGC